MASSTCNCFEWPRVHMCVQLTPTQVLVSIQAMIFVRHPVPEEPGLVSATTAGRGDQMVASLRVRRTCCAPYAWESGCRLVSPMLGARPAALQTLFGAGCAAADEGAKPFSLLSSATYRALHGLACPLGWLGDCS